MRDPVRRAAFAALCLWLWPLAAMSQDVVLRPADGPLRIEGTLLGYDGETYRVETQFGTLTVDATAVTCEGFGCPVLGAYVAELTVGGPDAPGLLPALLAAYGRGQGWDVVRRIAEDGRLSVILRQPGADADRLRVTFVSDLGAEALRDGRVGAMILRGEAPADLRSRVLAVDVWAREGWASESVRPLTVLTDPCGRSVPLDRVRLKTGDLAGTVPVALVTRPGRYPRAVRDWLSWLETAAPAPEVRRMGFADLAPERIPLAAQGERLASAVRGAGAEVSLEDLRAMLEALDGAERLTATLRFAPGSVRPDTMSSSVLQRLARDLEAGMHNGQELLLVGFSDTDGPAEGNRRISLRRAEMVRELLLDRAPILDRRSVRMTPLGLGEVMPIACEADEVGRRINRRVEIWTRPMAQQ